MICWFFIEAYSFAAAFTITIKHHSQMFAKRCIKRTQNFSKLNNFRHSLELQKNIYKHCFIETFWQLQDFKLSYLIHKFAKFDLKKKRKGRVISRGRVLAKLAVIADTSILDSLHYKQGWTLKAACLYYWSNFLT